MGPRPNPSAPAPARTRTLPHTHISALFCACAVGRRYDAAPDKYFRSLNMTNPRTSAVRSAPCMQPCAGMHACSHAVAPADCREAEGVAVWSHGSMHVGLHTNGRCMAHACMQCVRVACTCAAARPAHRHATCNSYIMMSP